MLEVRNFSFRFPCLRYFENNTDLSEEIKKLNVTLLNDKNVFSWRNLLLTFYLFILKTEQQQHLCMKERAG